MKIVSLNREHTKSANEVAFNVADALAPEVLSRVQHGMQLNLEGNVLHCSWKDNAHATHEPIKASHIEGLNKAFADAQAQADYEAQKIVERKDDLMRTLAAQTNLPIN